MSLPALPEIFGNYVLGDFNEVASPAPVDWLPQTPGWYLVGAAALWLLGRYTWQRLRHWYRNRYRREARRRLQALGNDDNLVIEINQLLKITAMEAFSRNQVASLCGSEWTQFLNTHCDNPPFSEGDCRLLADGVYRGAVIDSSTGAQLLRASLAWVAQHKNRYDD